MIIQFGNKLSKKGKSESFMESLNPKLKSEGFACSMYSDKRSVFFRMLDMVFELLKHRKMVELVIIHSFSTLAFWYTFFITLISKGLNLPLVIVLHGGDYPRRLKKYPVACRLIFKNANLNISPSLYLQRAFQKEGYEVVYVPNFVDITACPYMVHQSNSINLLWVRAFSEIYNPLLFVEIVQLLSSQGYEVNAAMVGPDSDGSLQNVRMKIIELQLENKVLITGKLEKQEWFELSKNYSYFINTTNSDNRPISVIEAMALGLPVISTNVGGLPDLIEHNVNGVLVNPNQAPLFVDAILKLYENPTLYKTLAETARHNVMQFDWRELKDVWLNLIYTHKRDLDIKG